MKQEISSRLGVCANIYKVSNTVLNKEIPNKAKVIIFKLYSSPVVTNGSATWNKTEKESSRPVR